jgi:hypothetical protein
MGRSQGWSFIGVIILVPVLAILLVTDFAVKVLTKGNLRYIWIIEVVIVIIMILLLKYKIF